jgi:hypothetical protein
MSRSYHITSRKAVKQFRTEGSSDGILTFLEKRYVKSGIKKLHDPDLPADTPRKKVIRRLGPRIAKAFMKRSPIAEPGASESER